jgi:hypothetical protein
VQDRRKERRVKMLKAGKVVLTDCLAVNCAVRDISPNGARLEFEGPVALPETFSLRLVSAELDIPATVIWQRRLEAGIRFTDAGSSAARNRPPIASAA